MSHPLDVVVLFPSLLRALAGVCEVLSEAGLAVYLEEEEQRWYWRWERFQARSPHGFATLEDAFTDALSSYVAPRGSAAADSPSMN
jgi:hypothetical protein